MSKKRTIAVITATRAEYGLFYPVLREIAGDPDLVLKLLVTGTHVQQKFGSTEHEIRAHGFDAIFTEDFFSSGDNSLDIVGNFGNSALVVAKHLDVIKPDILLVLGDRYEMLAFSIAALLMHIPIAHIAGGEITSGALDDSIRHAITKLASIHFVATEIYANRLIQMGEQPAHVHVTGSTGVENAVCMDLLSKEELEQNTGYKFAEKNLLATFHPVTTKAESSLFELKELLSALEYFPNVKVLWTAPNADECGLEILAEIEAYVATHSDRAQFIKSLGFKNYLSCLQHMDGVIGNSSSGIIEAPSFKIGTINIGSRQDGRTRASSVIDCVCEKSEIRLAIEKLYSDNFQNSLQATENPFYKKGTSNMIKTVLKETDLSMLMPKLFREVDI